MNCKYLRLRTKKNNSYISKEDLEYLEKYNNEIYKTIKSIKNVNQLSYVINDYQTIIEKFYLVVGNFNKAFNDINLSSNSGNKDIVRSFGTSLKEIRKALTCYIELINFLAHRVLKLEDPICIELTKELRKKDIFDNQVYNHIMYGLNIKVV